MKFGSAAFILNADRHVLLVKHSYGALNWELPGGASEADESPVDTALRETREETGLQVVARHLTGIYHDSSTDLLHFVFWCEPQESEMNPMPDRQEITECRFWPPDALPRPISDWTVRRIEDALSGVTGPLPTRIGPRQWLE